MLRRLRRQIHELIATRVSQAIREALMKVLRRPGYAFHPDGACRAGGLALEVYGAASGKPLERTALLTAAAVELQMEALYIFDDVADAPLHRTRGEHLALASVLHTVGFAAAVQATADSPDGAVALDHFCSAYNESAAGQFLDAMLQRRGRATLEEAIETTCLKAGGLGKFVTGFAARVAGADPDGVSLFERFGDHVFILAQLIDDLRDASAPGETSDLAQGKATLPAVFFGLGIDSPVPPDGMLLAEVLSRYECSGAPLYAAILAHAYMSRATEDLSLLAQHGYAVGGLERFLASVDAGAGEILGSARASLVA